MCFFAACATGALEAAKALTATLVAATRATNASPGSSAALPNTNFLIRHLPFVKLVLKQP
jgi:hypothetical protein